MTKKNLATSIFLLLTSLGSIGALASDTLRVDNLALPLIVNDERNPIFDLSIDNSRADAVLSNIVIEFAANTPLQHIAAVELYYTGTTSMIVSRTRSQALRIHHDRFGGGQQIYKHPAYSVPAGSTNRIKAKIEIPSTQKLFKGTNHFYVSLTLKPTTPLSATFEPRIVWAKVDKVNIPIATSGYNQPLRVGVSVRNAGDNQVDSYRIPGLARAKDGSMLAVYDIRHTSSTDLQEYIQVGLSRSLDKGHTWQPMQTIIDMSGYGVLPASQNGVGDPAILVDQKTGRVWVVALWNYGIGADRGWQNLKQGTSPEEEAAQIVVASSDDNGRTWSAPVNITSQVKLPKWFITLQGPGCGITMQDGTLVFAFQYVDTDRLPYATIIYSRDSGKSWQSGKGIKSNTTEAQVVELAPGELMINARDNRGGSRTVMTTADMGQTWVEHPSSRSALREPVCMASLIRTEHKGQPLLVFSNPDTTKGRSHITIKTSTDMGLTWSKGLLLDQGFTWGYSCLSVVDDDTVGILYEGSRSQMTFQAVPLSRLLE